MKPTFRFFFLLLLFCLSIVAQAQTGEIQGIVTDAQTGYPIAFAHVTIKSNSFLIETQTDSGGYYAIKGIPISECLLKITAVTYNNGNIVNIDVSVDGVMIINVDLDKTPNVGMCNQEWVCYYKPPLISQYHIGTGYTYTRKGIEKMPLW